MQDYILTKDDKKQFKKLDRLFSKYIKNRDGVCLYCGSFKELNCAHIASKRIIAGRWDELNAITLCKHCHTRIQHLNPVAFSDWLKEIYPASYQTSLEIMSKHIDLTDDFLMTTEKMIEEKTANIENYLKVNNRKLPDKYFGKFVVVKNEPRYFKIIFDINKKNKQMIIKHKTVKDAVLYFWEDLKSRNINVSTVNFKKAIEVSVRS